MMGQGAGMVMVQAIAKGESLICKDGKVWLVKSRSRQSEDGTIHVVLEHGVEKWAEDMHWFDYVQRASS